MSKTTLLKSLIDALRAAQSAMKAGNDGRASWAHIPKATLEPVADALRSLPEFKPWIGRVYTLPSEASVIDPESVATYLVDRATRCDPQEIIDSLFEVLASKSIDFLRIRLVSGITVAAPVSIDSNITLVPPHALPDAADKAWFFTRSGDKRHAFDTPPTAAIIAASKEPVLLVDAPKPGEQFDFLPATSEPNWEAALNAMMLCSDGAFEFRQSYSYVTNVGWIGMLTNGFGSSESFPVPIKHATRISIADVPKVYSALQSANGKFSLAIKRLDTSRRRLDRLDVAIDLGTCIETLLMHGTKSENTEISFKVGSRAAWLLGKDPTSRETFFKLARDLYTVRSKAVHNGELSAPKTSEQGLETEKQFQSFDQLCAQLIRKLMELGKYPDWNKLILGYVE